MTTNPPPDNPGFPPGRPRSGKLPPMGPPPSAKAQEEPSPLSKLMAEGLLSKAMSDILADSKPKTSGTYDAERDGPVEVRIVDADANPQRLVQVLLHATLVSWWAGSAGRRLARTYLGIDVSRWEAFRFAWSASIIATLVNDRALLPQSQKALAQAKAKMEARRK